jgi:hypothetical protein
MKDDLHAASLCSRIYGRNYMWLMIAEKAESDIEPMAQL